MDFARDFWNLFFRESHTGIWVSELKHPIRIGIPPGRQHTQLVKHAVLTECNSAMARMCGCRSPEELAGVPLVHLFPPSSRDILMLFLQTKCRVLPWTLSNTHGPGGRFFENMFIGRRTGGRLVRIWGMRRWATPQKLEEHRMRQMAGSLTTIQRRILEETVKGKTLKEIGADLSLSINTVESYRFRALRKLGLRSVTEMIRRSESLALGDPAGEGKISLQDFPDVVSP
ncbi:MAG: helix-turn-helix transcriptional regulator [Ignavibacterium sp.]